MDTGFFPKMIMPNQRQPAAGPVAQWLEPAAHNGLVAGSSPAGPTKKSVAYQELFRRSGITAPDTCAFRSPGFAHGDLLDGIREIIRVVMTIGVQQNLERHSKI